MKPCSRNTFLVTGTLLAMFLLHPAGQEASAADQGANPDKICKYKKKCSSCSSGDCSSDSSAKDDTVKIQIAHNEECKTDPSEAGLSDEYEFAGSEPVQPPKGRRSSDEPLVKMAGGFSSNYVHPKNLKLYGTGGEIVRDADTNVRQVKGDTGFMDVIFTPESKTLELRLYNPESVELKKLNGVYPIKAGEKALTIIRYVQEADGRVRTEKIDNTAEFPSVKSERVTQEVGTEPYTLIQTKTYLKGEGSSATEYKRVSKKITAVLNGAPKEEKYQYSQEEMGSDGQWHLTERKAGRRAIYKEEDGFVSLYECNAVNEDGTPMNPIATEITYTYYNDPLQVASHGKVKTLRRNDGYWENKYYDNNASAGLETEKTESPWLNTAANDPGITPAGPIRVKTEILCATDTGTEDITETVNGVLIAKEWTEKTPFDHQKVKEVRHQPHSGGDKITTTIRYRKANDIPTHLRGKPVSIHNADGSMILYSYELQDQNLIIKADEGYGSENSITHGIRTVSTEDKNNRKLREEVRYAIEEGQAYWLSSKTGVSFDGKGVCLKWVYNNDPDDYTEQRKDCCNIVWERGRDGIETNYTYDAAGHKTVTSTRGITYTTEYNGLTTIKWKQTQGSNNRFFVDQTTRNEAKQIVEKVVPAIGDKTLNTQFSFDIVARNTKTITPHKTTSFRIATADGHTLCETGTTGITKNYTSTPTSQNGGGLIVTVTDGNRNLTTTADLLGNIVLRQTSQNTLTQQVYDVAGRIIKKIMPDGETQLYTYENQMEISGIDLNGDGILNLTHDQMEKRERIFDPSYPVGKGSWKTTTAKAWQGNWKPYLTKWESEDGTLKRNKVPGLTGHVLQQKIPIAKSGRSHTDATVALDGQIREITNTMNDGRVTAITVTRKDATGQIISTENRTLNIWGKILTQTNDRTGITSYTYDESSGALLSQMTPDKKTTFYQYDDYGRQVTLILPDGSKQHIEYDNENRIIRQWGSLQYPVRYEYNVYGEKIGMTTYRVPVNDAATWPEGAEGDKSTWNYELVSGRLLNKIYADGKSVSYTYTLGGKLLTVTNSRGDIISYTHDVAGRLTAVLVNDNGVTPEKKYHYDQLGRRVSAITEGVANYQYYYNDWDQVVEEVIIIPTENGNLQRSIIRSYDLFGRLSCYQLKQGDFCEQNIDYSYNSVGQQEKVTVDDKEFAYTYLPNDPQLLSQMSSPVHTVINNYEANGNTLVNKINRWNNKIENSIISEYNYAINSLGQRVSVSTKGEAFGVTSADWTWEYDSLGQVIRSNDEFYAYDQIGNRKTSTKGGETISYTSNELNQYVEISNITPTYDFDGNQLNGLAPSVNCSGRDIFVFAYDAENRVISISQNGETVEKYSYDHMGRRIKKGNSIALYDGYNAIAEYDGNNFALKKTYAWGNDFSGTAQGVGGVGGLLCVTEKMSQIPFVSYPCYDGNGNVTEYLTEENSGTITAHYEYDSYGNERNKKNENKYIYRFSTKSYDEITGLYYYNYRFYDPAWGRWINRDPSEENGGISLLCFVANNPISTFDYLGLCSRTSLGSIEGSEFATVPPGIFFGGRLKGEMELDDCDCCIYGKIEMEAEFGLGIKVQKSFKAKRPGFEFGYGFNFEASYAKTKAINNEIELKYCPDTKELSGGGDISLLNIQLGGEVGVGGNGGLTSSDFGIKGDINASGTGKLTGDATLGAFVEFTGTEDTKISMYGQASVNIMYSVSVSGHLYLGAIQIAEGEFWGSSGSAFDEPVDTGKVIIMEGTL